MSAKRMQTATAVFVLVMLGSAAAKVQESRVSYDCTDMPTVKFNQDCINRWNINDKVFAESASHSPADCFSPCKKIEDGLMILDSCENVTVFSHCHSKDGVTEKRIHYYSQPSRASTSGQRNQAAAASVRPSPAAMLVAGLFVTLMILML